MEQRPLRSQLMYTNDSNTSQPVVRDVPDLADHILGKSHLFYHWLLAKKIVILAF